MRAKIYMSVFTKQIMVKLFSAVIYTDGFIVLLMNPIMPQARTISVVLVFVVALSVVSATGLTRIVRPHLIVAIVVSLP